MSDAERARLTALLAKLEAEELRHPNRWPAHPGWCALVERISYLRAVLK